VTQPCAGHCPVAFDGAVAIPSCNAISSKFRPFTVVNRRLSVSLSTENHARELNLFLIHGEDTGCAESSQRSLNVPDPFFDELSWTQSHGASGLCVSFNPSSVEISMKRFTQSRNVQSVVSPQDGLARLVVNVTNAKFAQLKQAASNLSGDRRIPFSKKITGLPPSSSPLPVPAAYLI
jgi:hypothetical protein